MCKDFHYFPGPVDGGGPAGGEGGRRLPADRPRDPLRLRGLRRHQQEDQGHVQVPQDAQVQHHMQGPQLGGSV